ncbi:MAG TPA: ABC transporter permease [Bryobacteraceae bacterium]|nr:ABC transporter permease [Bryobacteraceae bacterium]
MRRSFSRELSVAGAIAGLFLLLAIRAPGYFGSENLADIFMTNVPVLLIALGMTLVILTGQIDISVGSMFAVCSVAAGVFAKAGLPMPVAGAAACLTGAFFGALNGGLVAYARVPSIVVTLAAMVALRDGLRWATQGAWIEDLPRGFQWLGFSQRSFPAASFLIASVLTIAALWGLRHLPAGRAVYATGSNEEAARLAGINTRVCVFSVFTLMGALTGLAALLNSVRFNQIPSNAGLGLEMKVIAAVVVGGTAITGGTGSIMGTLLGVILLGVIGPALTFLGINAYWEKALQGAIILAAIAADGARARVALRGLRRYASSPASTRA